MNYVGMQIGFLTVVNDSGLRTKDHKRIYECRCQCGGMVLRPSTQLLRCIRIPTTRTAETSDESQHQDDATLGNRMAEHSAVPAWATRKAVERVLP